MEQSKIKIYQSSDGQARIDVRLERDTVWLSQAQMAELFGRDQSVISRHIRNALTESEVNEESNMQKIAYCKLQTDLSQCMIWMW